MGKIDELKNEIFGSSSKKIDELLDNISTYLIDFNTSKFEVLFNILSNYSTFEKTDNGIDTGIKTILNNFLKIINDNASRINISIERLNKYKIDEELFNRIPEIAEAISVYTDNILSPDDFTKKAIKINIFKLGESIDYKNKAENLVEKYNFEKNISRWINNFLIYGDYFLEIKTFDLNTFFSENGQILNKKVVPISFNIDVEKKKTTILKTENSRVDAYNFLKFFKEDTSYTDLSYEIIEHHPKNVIILSFKNTTIGYLVINGKNKNSFINNSFSIQNPNNTNINSEKKLVDDLLNSFVKKLVETLPKLKDVVEEDNNFKVSLYYFLNQYKENENINVNFVPVKNMVHFSLPNALSYPYGDSIFSKVRTIGLYLILMEFAMLIYRLVRAPERRIFKVETGRTQDVQNYLQQIIRKTKQKEIYLKDANTIDTLLSEISMFEDYFIPVVDGRESFSIDSTPAGELNSKLEDIEYLRKKLISGLGIPAIYLISEENVESKYTLSQENIKFARTIIRLQKYISESITDLFRKLWTLIYKDKIAKNISLTLNPPIALQMERTNEVLSNIKGIIDVISEMTDIKKDILIERFLSPFMDISDLYESIHKQKLERKLKYSEKELEQLEKGENESSFNELPEESMPPELTNREELPPSGSEMPEIPEIPESKGPTPKGEK